MAGDSRLTPSIWNHQRHPLTTLRKAIEAELAQLPSAAGSTAIDLGCGDRPYSTLFETKGCRYIACDLTGDVECRIVPGQRVDLPDAMATFVLSFQVLEHVWDLDWYIGECRRLIKPDGWLLLSTHGTWPYHPHPTDYRRWTRDGLSKEIQTRGFEVVRLSGLVGPLAWTTQIRALGYREVFKKHAITRVVSPLLMASMNLRMALEDAITPQSIVDDNACIYVVSCRPR